MDISRAVQTGEGRYQPEINLGTEEKVNQERLARFVGYVALGLPTALILVGLFLSTCLYDSISHFYYAQFWGSVFIGCLIFIGAYLLVWEGQNRGEKLLGTIAAPFAWGVALFPTSGAGCTEPSWEGRAFIDFGYDKTTGLVSASTPSETAEYFELLSWTTAVHFLSAAVLFVVLAYLALVVFTRVVPGRDADASGQLRPGKLRRNKIYRICGWIMLLCIAALGGRAAYEWLSGTQIEAWNRYNLTLVFEAIALYAFGVSWMVKGRIWSQHFRDT